MIGDTEFSIVDVETTGFSRKDRVLEIAILRTNLSGDVLDEYVTLVNPCRDVGPTHIHRIRASDVASAPLFEEIAGDVLTRLAGAVFVAHNVHFDMRFIRSEFERIGCVLPDLIHICTMQLARRADSAIPSRRLEDVCRHFGIGFANLHSAEADVRAEARLLSMCLAEIGAETGILATIPELRRKPTPRESWPVLPVSGRSYRRSDAARITTSEVSYIARLVAQLPVTNNVEPDIEQYLFSLDKVLEDRLVTPEEAGELLKLAGECGITHDRAIAAHEAYLLEMLRIALQDGVITPLEQDDLDNVRRLLGVTPCQYGKLLAQAGLVPAPVQSCEEASSGVENLQGKSVCFTGTLAGRIDGQLVTRDLAERIASERGMVVLPGVTKKLDFLVVADPNSMSGKAQKARTYGIRVIAEPVFWKMLGVRAD